MATFTIPNVFVANTVIKSADMNANFAAIAAILNSSLLPPIGGTPGDIVSIDISGNFTSIPAPAIKGDLLSFSTVPDVLPVGSDGQVLTADSTQPSGLSYKTPTATADAGELNNVGLAVSASAGALTVALKQSDGSTDPTSTNAAIIAVRSPSLTTGSYNLRSVIAPLSITVPVGVPLGSLVGLNTNIWVYALDTDGSGTMGLGLSTVKQDSTQLHSTFIPQQTATITIANPAVITTSAAHGYSQNDPIIFSSTGSLPTGITAGQVYFVYNPSGTTFNISVSPSAGTNTAVTTSGSQSGTHSISISSGSIVASANYSDIAIRLIGRAKFNLSSQGTWVAPLQVTLSPSELAGKELIAFQAISSLTTSTATIGVPANFTFNTVNFDTHNLSARIGVDGLITVPREGFYEVNTSFMHCAVTADTQIILVDSQGNQFTIMDRFTNQAGVSPSVIGSQVVGMQANSGFYIQVSILATGMFSNDITNPSYTSVNVTYLGDLL